MDMPWHTFTGEHTEWDHVLMGGDTGQNVNFSLSLGSFAPLLWGGRNERGTI